MMKRGVIVGAVIAGVAIVALIVVAVGQVQAVETGKTVDRTGEQIAFLHYPPTGYSNLYVIDAGSGALTQLTRREVVRGAVLSPDGARAALVVNAEPRINVYVLDLGTGKLAALKSEQGNAASPAWSPDGQQIAYTDGKMIVVSSADGSAPRDLVEGRDPAWSPDGKQIVYRATEKVDESRLNFELYVVDVASGEARRLLAREGAESNPEWSPDGEHILFMDDIWDQWGGVVQQYLVVANADGSDARRIDEVEVFHRPSWSPDGLSILYERPNWDICQAAIDGGDPVCGDSGEYPAWSPDGVSVLFAMDDLSRLCTRSGSERRRCLDIDLEGRLVPLGWRPNARGNE